LSILAKFNKDDLNLLYLAAWSGS